MKAIMIPVKSSMIKSISYNRKEKILCAQFMNDKIYSYKDVAIEDFVDVITSESVGKAFSSIIKKKYKGELLTNK